MMSLRKMIAQNAFSALFSRWLSWAIALTLCLTSFSVATPPAFADAASSAALEATQPLSTLADSADIPADKVDQFAAAYLQVLQVLSDREPELPAAETSAESLKVQQSIEDEAIAAIQESGLTMPEYMQILGLASQDAGFRDKVLGRMDESMQN